jgi:FAD binding domain/Berberine and berberine like
MPNLKSRKSPLDAIQIAALRSRHSGDFTKLGISLVDLEKSIIGLVGRIVFPWDPEYDKDRKLANPIFDSHPKVIIYCLTESDVRICLALSWISGLRISIRAGGHSTAGFSSGPGILVDVSGLNDASIDPVNSILTVGPGTTSRQVAKVLDSYGAHVPYSECDSVCIGGFVQGGGYALSSRTFGMSGDNVLSMRVMLADGSIVTASEKTNYDLWWAMRGGTGNNFGVLLSVDYAVKKITPVYGWQIRWPLASQSDRQNAAAALMVMQDQFFIGAPAKFNIQPTVWWLSKGTPQLLVYGVYFGSCSDGRLLLQPLLNTTGATLVYEKVDSYSTLSEILTMFEPPDPPATMESVNEAKRSGYVTCNLALNDWLSLLDFLTTNPPNYWSYFYLDVCGGSINSYPVAESAFIHRNSVFSACLDVFWQPGDDPGRYKKFLNDWYDLMKDFWNGEVYQNYPSEEVADYRTSYWGKALDALVAVKAKYDPCGFFRFSQMVSPLPRIPSSTPVTWPPNVALALASPIVRMFDSPWPASALKLQTDSIF